MYESQSANNMSLNKYQKHAVPRSNNLFANPLKLQNFESNSSYSHYKEAYLKCPDRPVGEYYNSEVRKKADKDNNLLRNYSENTLFKDQKARNYLNIVKM